MSCPFSNKETSDGTCSRKVMEYSDYLGLAGILASQKLESEKHGKKHHDEHLFMVVHQAFELWFKQVIYEFDSVIELMTKHFDERKSLTVVQRLQRVVLILDLILNQFAVLGTMTPHAFLDFREFLSPASGFQSVQFRVLENKFGLDPEKRVLYQQNTYRATFSRGDQLHAIDSSVELPSLFETVNAWLERTPGIDDIWQNYKKAYMQLLDEQHTPNEGDNEETKLQKQKALEKQKEVFAAADDPANTYRRMSPQAYRAALMITVYSQEPRFQLPSQLLSLLMDIDARLIEWRQKHAMIVHKMIGSKQGTANSSGYMYLRSTLSDHYKVFKDLYNTATFLLPTDRLPALSSQMGDRLAFKETSVPQQCF